MPVSRLGASPPRKGCRKILVREQPGSSSGTYSYIVMGLYHGEHNMASWSSGRPSNARRITLSLSDELKNTLVRTKALTGKSFNFQIIEALRGLTAATPPAVVPGPCQVTRPIVPTKYASMREQKVTLPSPWK